VLIRFSVKMGIPTTFAALGCLGLTTFSVANDIAKYFAIIAAAFVVTYPQLGALNIMRLHSPTSSILSAVIFKALIIIALIPLALKGVKYRAEPADRLLSRNLLIYGVGEVIAPFIGIKLIDLVLSPFMGYQSRQASGASRQRSDAVS
jgi:K+-transporting ATPase ATPase B chain